MKFNWGYKILFVYLAFVAGILYLVIQSSRQDVDLVTPDYYAEELKYQDKIDQRKRAEALSEKVSCQLRGTLLDIRFPAEFSDKEITGNILLYYPANSQRDIKAPVKTEQNAMQLALPNDTHGMHILQISWQAEGVSYYWEETLFIP